MSRLIIETSRSGHPTARLGDRWLHSRFDPVREAERFVSVELDAGAEVVILLGPGLGYLVSAVRSLRPATRVIACALVQELSDNAVAHADATWKPDGGVELDEFLNRELSDLESAACAFLEWPPTAAVAPELAADARHTIGRSLSRAQASLMTRGAAGRRWFRNALHNYLHVSPFTFGVARRRVGAVVVAGAGPSLETAIPYLRRFRTLVDLWATGSALEALSAGGLEPDLVIVTDPALYATEHLRPLFTTPGASVPVAAPLSATRGISRIPATIVISQDEHTDAALLPDGPAAPPVVPPHGTVTATALELARRLTRAPLLITGVDFAWRDERSHARPHLSQRYRLALESRLNPATTGLYAVTRTHRNLGKGWTTERTLQTYAAWLSGPGKRRYAPLYALDQGPPSDALPRFDPERLPTLAAHHPVPGWIPAPWPAREQRVVRARAYLSGLGEVVTAAREPRDARSLRASHPEIERLAIELALPTLLSWQRATSPTQRTRHWTELRDRLCSEIAGLEELVQ